MFLIGGQGTYLIARAWHLADLIASLTGRHAARRDRISHQYRWAPE